MIACRWAFAHCFRLNTCKGGNLNAHQREGCVRCQRSGQPKGPQQSGAWSSPTPSFGKLSVQAQLKDGGTPKTYIT